MPPAETYMVIVHAIAGIKMLFWPGAKDFGCADRARKYGTVLQTNCSCQDTVQA
jgi:hypothetical protein